MQIFHQKVITNINTHCYYCLYIIFLNLKFIHKNIWLKINRKPRRRLNN